MPAAGPLTPDPSPPKRGRGGPSRTDSRLLRPPPVGPPPAGPGRRLAPPAQRRAPHEPLGRPGQAVDLGAGTGGAPASVDSRRQCRRAGRVYVAAGPHVRLPGLPAGV